MNQRSKEVRQLKNQVQELQAEREVLQDRLSCAEEELRWYKLKLDSGSARSFPNERLTRES